MKAGTGDQSKFTILLIKLTPLETLFYTYKQKRKNLEQELVRLLSITTYVAKQFANVLWWSDRCYKYASDYLVDIESPLVTAITGLVVGCPTKHLTEEQLYEGLSIYKSNGFQAFKSFVGKLRIKNLALRTIFASDAAKKYGITNEAELKSTSPNTWFRIDNGFYDTQLRIEDLRKKDSIALNFTGIDDLIFEKEGKKDFTNSSTIETLVENSKFNYEKFELMVFSTQVFITNTQNENLSKVFHSTDANKKVKTCKYYF